jgi:hypothetical protein
MGPLQFHDLVQEHADGPCHAVEAVLGQQFRDLVECGSLIVVGHCRWSPLVRLAPSRGTGGGPPLQPLSPPGVAGYLQKTGCTTKFATRSKALKQKLSDIENIQLFHAVEGGQEGYPELGKQHRFEADDG